MIYPMKKRKLAVKSPSKRENADEETEKELSKLGDRIKQLRVKKGYTSYEIFAFENGINRAQADPDIPEVISAHPHPIAHLAIEQC